ncbi:hypothetical protein JNM05_13205 [bacterium]|nr:hypothetical protein [bacterium]
MKRFRLVIIMSLFTFGGCTNYATSTKKDPNCTTVVCGKFVCAEKWVGKYPALMIKDMGETKSYFGEITEIDSAGVWFDRTKEGFVFSSPRYYPFKKIVCLIDENNDVIYGSIPKKYGGTWDMDIMLAPVNVPGGKAITLRLEANKEFAFCLEPNEYLVGNIMFNRGNDYIDVGKDIPVLKFMAQSNKWNYIGDIYMDSTVANVAPIKITCKIGSRPSDAANGAMFGLVGAVLLEMSRSGDRIEHKITVTNAGRPENAVESLITTQ